MGNNNNNTPKHRIPFAFLNDIKDRFMTLYGTTEPLNAIAFLYNEEYSRIIAERMNYYNSDEADKSIDNIGMVKGQIEDVKGVIVQNTEWILERELEIEIIIIKEL